MQPTRFSMMIWTELCVWIEYYLLRLCGRGAAEPLFYRQFHGGHCQLEAGNSSIPVDDQEWRRSSWSEKDPPKVRFIKMHLREDFEKILSKGYC